MLPGVQPAPASKMSAAMKFVVTVGWVAGSIVIGVLVGTSLGGLVAFCVIIELAAIPLILAVRNRMKDAA